MNPESIWCDTHHRVEEIDDTYTDTDARGRPIAVAISASGCVFTTDIRPSRRGAA